MYAKIQIFIEQNTNLDKTKNNLYIC